MYTHSSSTLQQACSTGRASQSTVTPGRQEIHLNVIVPKVRCIVLRRNWSQPAWGSSHRSHSSPCSHLPTPKLSQNTTQLLYWGLLSAQGTKAGQGEKGSQPFGSALVNLELLLESRSRSRSQIANAVLLTTMESVHLRKVALHNQVWTERKHLILNMG